MFVTPEKGMIARLRRDRNGYVLDPSGEGEPYWLSPGGLRHLRRGGYDPESQHRVSVFLVTALLETGHLRPLAHAPRTGTMQAEFSPPRVQPSSPE
jgi:hypothetical protein